MIRFFTALLLAIFIQSCQIMSNAGIDPGYSGDSFSSLSHMQGEWDIVSEVEVAFDLFESSEAKSKIKANSKKRVLKERFRGYYKDDKWRVSTTYHVVGEDSLKVVVSDSRDSVDRHFEGTFMKGFISVVAADGCEKLEMRLLDDRMVRKVFRASPYKKEDWKLVLHWEYVRD